ncbi:MAG: hypothetical protein QM270_01835 [Bacillota bacterium]|nr:hypothetical protein [Bacillota bacterium]
MKKTKLISLLMALTLLSTFLLSCAGDGQGGPGRTTAATTEQPQETVALEEGEILYVGSTSYPNLEHLVLRFVLAADKSSIHGVSIQITNLQAEISSGNTKTRLSLSQSTERFSGEYPVDYAGTSVGIAIGESRIERLHFEDDRAEVDLSYVYRHSSFGAGATVTEVPFGTSGFVCEAKQKG